jgi:hypothetical protein
MLLRAYEQQADHSTYGCSTNRLVGQDLMAVWLQILSFCPMFFLVFMTCAMLNFFNIS